MVHASALSNFDFGVVDVSRRLVWRKVCSGMRQAFRSCDFALVNPTSESLDGFRYGIHLRLFAMPAVGASRG